MEKRTIMLVECMISSLAQLVLYEFEPKKEIGKMNGKTRAAIFQQEAHATPTTKLLSKRMMKIDG